MQVLPSFGNEQQDGCNTTRWTWFGQSGFAVSLGTTIISWIDLYFSQVVEQTEHLRRICPVLDPGPLPPRQFLLTTHDHPDHFDAPTIIKLVERQWTIGGPRSCHLHYDELGLPPENFVELNAGSRYHLGSLTITAYASLHSSTHGLNDAVGFHMQSPSGSAYHCGDSLWDSSMRERLQAVQADVLFAPVNGRWGNMTREQTFLLADTVGASVIVPMHFGMFAENTISDTEINQYVLQGKHQGKNVLVPSLGVPRDVSH